jgi:trk system potassium uptake protein
MISFFLYRVRRRIQPFFDPSRLLVLSFAGVILLGGFLLWLPLCCRQAQPAVAFIDGLFTATSAVCVTGLTVLDTGKNFNFLGQVIVLLLIQAGGLGILTFFNMIVMAQRGRASLQDRLMLEQSHGLLPTIGPAQLLPRIFTYTALFEAAGTTILTWRFMKDLPFATALWSGIFHSVSAFCNAGFSLFSANLVNYQEDTTVNVTIMALIVMGGLGTIVFADVEMWLRRFRRVPRFRLTLHSKVVLCMTAFLIVAGAFLIYLLEAGGNGLPGSPKGKVLASFFLSVTSRTAGFNTVDLAQMTNATLLVVILLMAIGGSPGSTAGGVKTTTFATLLAYLHSRARNRPRVEMFRRSIPADIVIKAMLTIFGFLLVTGTAVVLLQITELKGQPFAAHRGDYMIAHLFEVVSGLGTVGLSTGITPGLSAAGKLVLIGCMFLGRVGPLVVAGSLVGSRHRIEYTYPEGKLLVG